MPQQHQHTSQPSFAEGFARGRREVEHGDYHHAVIGFAVLLAVFLLACYGAVKMIRWIVHL